jgi:hypothetical protein
MAMKTSTKFGVSVVGALAAGYLSIPYFTGGTYWNPTCGGDWLKCRGEGGDCYIPVRNVTCGSPGSGNYGSMDVQPVFSVCKRSRMVWDTDDHTLSFNATGIALKSSNPDFDPADADHRDWRFTWWNKHNNLGEIPYSVTVQKGGVDCAHLDPRIYNE